MKELRIYLLAILFICFISISGFAHSVQVAYSYNCNGDLRLYVEHWHNVENPATTTMTLQLNVGGVITNITGSPVANLQNVSLAALPTPATVFASCPATANTYNDWVYYDFPQAPCGVPITITVISGNTVFTQDGCSMYPATASLTIPCPVPLTIPNQTVCGGDAFMATNFPVTPGTMYTWINNNPSIGLAASGTGNIPAFTASNPSTVEMATITVLTNGCTTDSFTLTVNPKPILTITDPSPVCSPNTVNITASGVIAGSSVGAYTYWTNPSATNNLANPSAITNSATYYIQSINSVGCKNIQPVTVIINALPVLSITNPPGVCVPNTVDITASSITVGTVGTGTLSYWNDNAATSPLLNPTSISITGTYYIQITTLAGCKDIKPVIATVNELPNLFITNPLAVCTPNTVDITLGSLTSGSSGVNSLAYWTDPAATILLPNPTYISTTGTYYMEATTTAGCKIIKPIVVTIHPKPSLIITNPSSVCAPGTVDVTLPALTYGTIGSGTLSYWNNMLGTSALITPTAVNASGTYYIQISTPDGCKDIQPITVTINPLPVLVIANPPAVCVPNTVDITLATVTGGPGAFTYWLDSAATNPLINPHTIATNGKYYIKTVNSLGCMNVKPVIASIHAKPTAFFSVDISKGCPVHCVNFTDLSSISSGSSINTWNWNFGNGQNANVRNPAHCYSASGFYDVALIVGSDKGCLDTLINHNMIEVYPLPIAAFEPSPAIASVVNPTITFENQSSADVTHWQWDFGDGSIYNNVTTLNPVHVYPDVANASYTNTLVVENIHGCKDSTTRLITIGPEFTFFIPSAFTPNEDGVNDDFFGQGIGIVEYNIWIYDRWGNMIFHGDELNDEWNGKANYGEEPAQQDVYVWKVSLKDVFNKRHNYVGTVTLLR